MKELLRSNDPVYLSFILALLRDAGLAPILLDNYTAAVEGSIGAIPRRLMIAEDESASAFLVLREAGMINAKHD